MNTGFYKIQLGIIRKMFRCECRDIIFNHVPVYDLCDLIRMYSAATQQDKLNAAIDRSKKFEFSNGLGTYLEIKYADEQLCFARSNIHNSWYKCTMYCDIDNVAYLLQDSDMMSVVCSWAREMTSDKLNKYLAQLGMRLGKILSTCHTQIKSEM